MSAMPRVKKTTWMSGEEFASIRNELELTQVELAQRLDLTSTMVSGYERGKSPIPRILADLMRAAKAGRIKLK